jgi:hypothetical protein
MSLANIRANGVRMVTASCEACSHKADVNVDTMPETVTVPETGRRLRCSQCGGRTVSTRPAWHTAQRQGVATFGLNCPKEPLTCVKLQSGSVSLAFS